MTNLTNDTRKTSLDVNQLAIVAKKHEIETKAMAHKTNDSRQNLMNFGQPTNTTQ